MLYAVEWIETKRDGWKVATLKDLDGVVTENVSINKTDMKGDLQWPGFDTFQAGSTIEGNLWKNPTKGTYSLFPPKPKPPAYAGGSKGGAAVAKAMDRKEASIDKSMDRKEEGIKISASFRDATSITLELANDLEVREMSASEKWVWMQEKHKEVRDWYLKEWEKEERGDVPFR